MKNIGELTSEALRDICCAPENTDGPEETDFEKAESVERSTGRNNKNVFKD